MTKKILVKKIVITIAGMPGSGKTTIAKSLCKEFHLNYHTIGGIMRKMANARKISVTEINKLGETNKNIDKEVDEKQIKLGKRATRAVIDSRLGFHFIPNSIKILVTCKPKIAAKRVFSQKRNYEKYHTYKQALNYLNSRKKSEQKRYMKYYRVDVNDKKKYDIIYDTSKDTIPQTKKKIVKIVRKMIK